MTLSFVETNLFPSESLVLFCAIKNCKNPTYKIKRLIYPSELQLFMIPRTLSFFYLSFMYIPDRYFSGYREIDLCEYHSWCLEMTINYGVEVNW